MRKMIEAEQLHARILSRLDMTRDMEDEELTELIYEVLQEASQEEYLPLDQKTMLERNFSMHSGNWICCRNFWKTNRSQKS